MGNPGPAVRLITEEELRRMSDMEVLRHFLSTRGSVAPESSTEVREHGAVKDERYRQIGKGQCGTIYNMGIEEEKGGDGGVVAKVPNSMGKVEELFVDWKMHWRVYTVFRLCSQSITTNTADQSTASDITLYIPRPISWSGPRTTSFWTPTTISHFLPTPTSLPSHALLSERIPPLPRSICSALVRTLCPASLSRNPATLASFLGKEENQDVLIRIYLGRRSDIRKAKAESVRLRNFPLNIDEMQRLGLPINDFARATARSLALAHWEAGVDGNDVEFVLGGSPPSSTSPSVGVSLWMLDFNQCTAISSRTDPSDQDVKMLVDAFWWNDSYFPWPGDGGGVRGVGG